MSSDSLLLRKPAFVLINGFRRHRSALANLQLAPLGTVSQGAQGVDFATIPSLAINRIEVLRDGASAQYGSDAIAGVANIILKSNNEGGSATARFGEYFKGDGFCSTIAANAGFYFGDEGFVNVTVERSTSDSTSLCRVITTVVINKQASHRLPAPD